MATIRTSHAGSLPRTPELIEANKIKQAQNTARLAGESVSQEQEQEFDELLAASVTDLVKRQKNLGISLPNDGEYGHAMAADFDYGAWWHYSFARTGGLELHDIDLWEIPANRSTPGNIVLTSMPDRRDRNLFPNVYTDPKAGTDTGQQPPLARAAGASISAKYAGLLKPQAKSLRTRCGTPQQPTCSKVGRTFALSKNSLGTPRCKPRRSTRT